MKSDLRIVQAEKLMESFGWEIKHCRQVRDLAVALFDQLQSLHNLGSEEREILNAAALLHDIGWTASNSKHHKHSYKLILENESKLTGFTSIQVALIANIARYHRKAFPSLEHRPFAELLSDHQQKVRQLAAILRIADGLDRPHLQLVRELHCQISNLEVFIQIQAVSEAGLHIQAARDKRKLFELVYGLPLNFGVKSSTHQ